MSFRNRCQIAGAEGIIQLSVPLERGRDQKTIIKDVRIADRQDWQGQHWKTIVSCYNRSPWFEFYQDELGELYKKRFTFLLDWDLATFEWSIRTLGIPLKISLTEAFRKDYEEKEWLDRRGDLRPQVIGKLQTSLATAATHPAAAPVRPATDLPAPATAPASPVAPTALPPAPDPPVKYRQVFEERTGFLPGLSILDLLFCEGRNARSLLEG